MKRAGLITSILSVIMLLLLNTPILAADAGAGTITGKIINITSNSTSSVGNVDITLNVYLSGAQKDPLKTKTDADGSYVFKGLATDPKYAYEVAVTYQEADYQSDQVTFAKDETTKSITDLKVYDSTPDDIIKVDVVHTLVTAGEGGLKVEKYVTFNNDTDKAYVGSKKIAADPTKKETLRFAVPQGATNVSYDSGLMSCCAFTGGDGFVYGMAVFPGKLDVTYSYNLPFKSADFVYNEKFEYATPKYNFLFQGDGVTAASDPLTTQPPVTVESKQYSLMVGGDFTAGQTIGVKLSGLTPSSNQNAFLLVAIGVVVVGGGAGALYKLRKRKSQPAFSPVSGANMPRQSRQAILAEIARLDDDYEAGKIPAHWYRALRAQKKAQLASSSGPKSGNMGRPAKNVRQS